jgi:hypothetical protein
VPERFTRRRTTLIAAGGARPPASNTRQDVAVAVAEVGDGQSGAAHPCDLRSVSARRRGGDLAGSPSQRAKGIEAAGA